MGWVPLITFPRAVFLKNFRWVTTASARGRLRMVISTMVDEVRVKPGVASSEHHHRSITHCRNPVGFPLLLPNLDQRQELTAIGSRFCRAQVDRNKWGIYEEWISKTLNVHVDKSRCNNIAAYVHDRREVSQLSLFGSAMSNRKAIRRPERRSHRLRPVARLGRRYGVRQQTD